MIFFIRFSLSLILIIGVLAFVFSIVGDCFDKEKLSSLGFTLLKVCGVLFCTSLVVGFVIYILMSIWL